MRFENDENMFFYVKFFFCTMGKRVEITVQRTFYIVRLEISRADYTIFIRWKRLIYFKCMLTIHNNIFIPIRFQFCSINLFSHEYELDKL